MKAGHFLIEVLGQGIHVDRVLLGLREQLDLRQHLVGEGVAHHEAGVPGGVSEVEQPPLGQDDDRLAVVEGPLVHLRLDLLDLHTVDLREARHVDLVVEVADVAEDRLVLHLLHLLGRHDVDAAGGGDYEVCDVEHVVECRDLVAVHRRLQSADRVDLGDDDAGALTAQGLGAPLADVPVAADDSDLPADQDVGGPVDSVDQRVPATVLVVELALGHGVVDVDGGEQQAALAHHLVEAVHTGGGLLRHALDAVGDRRPHLRVLREGGGEELEDLVELPAVTGGLGDLALLLELHTLVDQ